MDPKNSRIDRLFEFRSVEKKKLILSLTITIIVMFVEIFGALVTNSIALLSDSGHMFTHAFAIGISLFAMYIASKPACDDKTFGLYRAEILAAFINGLFLLPIVGFILYEAILRTLFPQDIDGLYMLFVAIIGLIVNIASILILQGSQNNNLGVKSVFYHMIADAASSVGIVVISIIIMFSGWTILDPIVSFVISIVILYWAWGILRDSSRILLEKAPKGFNIFILIDEIKKEFHNIRDMYNVHLWTITPGIQIFSAYIQVNDEKFNTGEFISKLNDFLEKKYKILESTLQITTEDKPEVCNFI